MNQDPETTKHISDRQDPDTPKDPSDSSRIREKIQERKQIISGSLLFKIAIIGLFIFINYQAVKFYGSIFYAGYLMIPFWIIVIYLFLDRQNYRVIEVKLEGDLLDRGIGDIKTTSTETTIWRIPPSIWDKMKKHGKPYHAGERTYICDHLDQENLEIYFPEDEILSNINFYLRLDIWMEIKSTIPDLMRRLTRFRWNNEIIAEMRTVESLEDLGFIREWIQDPNSRKGERKTDPDTGKPIIKEGSPHGTN